jgi:hypothetical protein
MLWVATVHDGTPERRVVGSYACWLGIRQHPRATTILVMVSPILVKLGLGLGLGVKDAHAPGDGESNPGRPRVSITEGALVQFVGTFDSVTLNLETVDPKGTVRPR